MGAINGFRCNYDSTDCRGFWFRSQISDQRIDIWGCERIIGKIQNLNFEIRNKSEFQILNGQNRTVPVVIRSVVF